MSNGRMSGREYLSLIGRIMGFIASFITIGTFVTNRIASEQYSQEHETIYRIFNGGFDTPQDWEIRFLVSLVIAIFIFYLMKRR
jgi:hypothetical protein